MNKLLITLFAVTLPSMLLAQLKVDTNGHVGISTTATSFNSPFSVGSSGGTEAYVTGGSLTKVVGVSGCPMVNAKGAGIFGSSSYPYYNYIDGQYAGFFYGNVKVSNGTINGTVTSGSDARLKEDITDIADTERGDDGSVAGKLVRLTPISYHYKDMNAGKDRGTYTDKYGNEVELPEEEPSQVMTKRHFGFIAQELQQVYPDLVYEEANGYLSVNYTELIPILVESIKELKAEVDELKAAASKENGGSLTNGVQDPLSLPYRDGAGIGTSLSQNVPNPFTEKTDIAIFLPESVREATLYIYDLSGKQLEQHPIEGRGETVMTIHADKMDAGMYIYSLIADKKVVTTKKMIVVK